MKKIFLLLGHPDKDTFSGALANEYERGALEAGHTIRRMNVGDLVFDPILHKGYKVIQELEQDLIFVQNNIQWAEHIVIVYPNWWITMPALLKGMFDRMFLPGFAFRFNKKTKKVEQLLQGKSGRVIVVSGTHNPLKIRFAYGDFTNEITRGILGFSGVKPIKKTCFGPSEHCSEEKKERWKQGVYTLGKKGV